MQLVIMPNGLLRCLYSETLDLHAFGRPKIARASQVEPDEQGHWIADLALVGGPKLGPFTRRSEALEAETRWLEQNWVSPSEMS